MEVSPPALIFGAVALGSDDTLELRVANSGEATLRVSSVTVETNSGFVALAEDQPSSFELGPDEEGFLAFTYAPTAAIQTSGLVRIRSNDPDASNLTIDITTPPPAPLPLVVPAVLDFGVVPVNTTQTIDGRVRNAGFAPLVICSATVAGSPEISSNLEAQLAANVEPRTGRTVVAPFEGAAIPGALAELLITFEYRPAAPGRDNAEFFLTYDEGGNLDDACNDPSETVTVSFPISAEAGTPLLARDPCPLDFGERALTVTHEESVTLTNLGQLPLQVFDIRLDPARSASTFALRDLPSLPLTLAADENEGFTVSYRPVSLAAESGVILIEHDDAAGDRVVSECTVAGVGSDNAPPVALVSGSILQDIQNRRGTQIDWALPIQTLILDGTASYDPDGDAIVEYLWDVVTAPPSAVGGVQRYDGQPGNPAFGQFFLPIAGRYEVCLTVTDNTGTDSAPACVQVVAVPSEAISIELTWRTPGDPDETDDTGADLDLHFVKLPYPWFHPTFDTFYGNISPNWSPETPSLDIDDTDGLGPETVQLNNPQDCGWYAVGVHYFRQRFGETYANVRIFINGRQVDEQVNLRLRDTDDFWDVARIHWPSGTVFRAGRLYEAFSSSDGIAPQQTDASLASGLCGAL